MTELLIDDGALQFIRDELDKENAPAVRLFVKGGGCCLQVDIAAVEKPLTRDTTIIQRGITFHVDRYLNDNMSSIELSYDPEKDSLKANVNYRIE